ncbi:hypothetical protein [Ruegeria atlantica]|uniref:hypothetical protein n=1 Tax=Ruegeria atlantica TaxID=81569 RepID=UPI0024946115|nr:hypothetical protein [Ruegeria atlantica]
MNEETSNHDQMQTLAQSPADTPEGQYALLADILFEQSAEGMEIRRKKVELSDGIGELELRQMGLNALIADCQNVDEKIRHSAKRIEVKGRIQASRTELDEWSQREKRVRLRQRVEFIAQCEQKGQGHD